MKKIAAFAWSISISVAHAQSINGTIHLKNEMPPADYSLQMNGQESDKVILDHIFASNTQGRKIVIPGGQWPSQSWYPQNSGSTKFVEANGYLYNPPNTSIRKYKIDQGFVNFGNGITSLTHGDQYFSPSTLYSRVTSGNIDKSFEPMISFRQLNEGASSNSQGNETVDITTISSPTSSGYMDGLFNKMFSMGMNYAGGFDVNHWSRTQAYGTNWVWDNLQELAAVVPFNCPSSASKDTIFCTQYIMNEEDYTGTIIEDDRTAYAPSYRRGTILGLGTGHLIAKTGVGVTWASHTTYHRYQIIIAYDQNKKPYMYQALPQNYVERQAQGDSVSGSTQPVWTFTKGNKIKDGTIEWTCLGPYHLDLGAVISVMGGNDPVHGWIERIGTYLAGNTDYIYDAAIDMSEAQWDPGNKFNVFSRQQANVYNDFTADGTASGQNNHLLGYSSNEAGMTYKVKGNTVVRITDDGTLTTNSGASFGASSGGAVGLQLGSHTVARPAFIDFHSGGNNNASARIISNNKKLNVMYSDVGVAQSFSVGASFYLGVMSRVEILALPFPKEGQKVFNSDDHSEVTYRCPTSATCAWFPVQYGNALK